MKWIFWLNDICKISDKWITICFFLGSRVGTWKHILPEQLSTSWSKAKRDAIPAECRCHAKGWIRRWSSVCVLVTQGNFVVLFYFSSHFSASVHVYWYMITLLQVGSSTTWILWHSKKNWHCCVILSGLYVFSSIMNFLQYSLFH